MRRIIAPQFVVEISKQAKTKTTMHTFIKAGANVLQNVFLVTSTYDFEDNNSDQFQTMYPQQEKQTRPISTFQQYEIDQIY